MFDGANLSDVEPFDSDVARLVASTDAGWSELASQIEDHLAGRGHTAFTRGLVECGALADPHLFGWVHQHLGTSARARAFEQHTRYEAKHADSVVATQIYTPRWVAELLLRGAFEGLDASATVTDPACGGGQFLLVAFEELVARGAPARDALGQVSGTDLDPDAVDAARRGLTWAAVGQGVPEPAARKLAEAAVSSGDGLDLAADSADIVATNPPYIGNRSMPAALKERLRADFRPFHLDLAAAFIDRCVAGARHSTAILSQQNIWYLSRFEEARKQLLRRAALRLFVHFGAHLFGVLSGEKASVVGFVLGRERRESATFYDLRDEPSAEAMRAALADAASARPIAEVTSLPGTPIAHWVPEPLLQTFGDDVPRIGDLFHVPGSQNKTGRNRAYVREASEVDDIAPLDAETSRGERWRYYSKGGRFAPWWGNWDWAVDWSDEARAFYADNKTSNLLADRWVDRVGLVYTDFGGRTFNARWKPATALFDMAGPAIFHPDDDLDALATLLVYLNSQPARLLLNALNPSLHYQVRDVRRLPLPGWEPDRFAASGHELVALTRAVLDNPSSVAQLRQTEARVHRDVCELFGVEDEGRLPLHHRLG